MNAPNNSDFQGKDRQGQSSKAHRFNPFQHCPPRDVGNGVYVIFICDHHATTPRYPIAPVNGKVNYSHKDTDLKRVSFTQPQALGLEGRWVPSIGIDSMFKGDLHRTDALSLVLDFV
jgi:hypothetical protein